MSNILSVGQSWALDPGLNFEGLLNPTEVRVSTSHRADIGSVTLGLAPVAYFD